MTETNATRAAGSSAPAGSPVITEFRLNRLGAWILLSDLNALPLRLRDPLVAYLRAQPDLLRERKANA